MIGGSRKRKNESMTLQSESDAKHKVHVSLLGDLSLSAREAFEQALRSLETEVVHCCRASKRSPTKGQDPLLLFNWNEAGLQARVATAQRAGLRTSEGETVRTAEDMKDAIFHLLCCGEHAGTDLGGRHTIVHFRPAHRRDAQMEALLGVGSAPIGHAYLRHRGRGYPQELLPEEAEQWPDIVHSLQVVTVTAVNALAGPVDVPSYFNG